MATAIDTTMPAQISSDAEYRTLGGWISGNFDTFGWTQTADTGQADWGTATRAGTANTEADYEMWEMGDSLQATYPVFLRIGYGAGTTADRFSLWIQIGTGSDGSGNLTGVIGTSRQIGQSSNSATAYNSYMSGSTNRVNCSLFTITSAGSTLNLWFNIERTHDANGADTGDGVMFCGQNGTSGPRVVAQYYFDMSAGDLGTENQLGVLLPHQGTGANGSDIALYPVLLSKAGGPFVNPFFGVIVAFTSNVSALSTFSVPIYGSSHTYIASGTPNSITGPSNWVRGTTANAAGVHLRYE